MIAFNSTYFYLIICYAHMKIFLLYCATEVLYLLFLFIISFFRTRQSHPPIDIFLFMKMWDLSQIIMTVIIIIMILILFIITINIKVLRSNQTLAKEIYKKNRPLSRRQFEEAPIYRGFSNPSVLTRFTQFPWSFSITTLKDLFWINLEHYL